MNSSVRESDVKFLMVKRYIKKTWRLEADELEPTKKFSLKPQIARMGASATLRTKLKTNELRSKGEVVYDFGLGESPIGAPKSIVNEIAKNAHRTSYLPTEGIPELRESISKFYEEYFDNRFEKKRVIIGPGSKELLFNSMVVLDTAWMFISPSWVSYEAQARILKFGKIGNNLVENFHTTLHEGEITFALHFV